MEVGSLSGVLKESRRITDMRKSVVMRIVRRILGNQYKLRISDQIECIVLFGKEGKAVGYTDHSISD